MNPGSWNSLFTLYELAVGISPTNMGAQYGTACLINAMAKQPFAIAFVTKEPFTTGLEPHGQALDNKSKPRSITPQKRA